MTVSTVTTGRGAWTAIAKGNKSRYYEYIPGKPLDGSEPTRDVNYQAVNLGVKGIQERINAFGCPTQLVTDGVLGPKSQAGIRWVQGFLGLYVDGQAGPTTCKALWHDLIKWFAAYHGVPAPHIWGFMMAESMADPGAVGYSTPSDRGLFQVNLVAHTAVKAQEAFNPVWSVNYTCARLRSARDTYSAKGKVLQTQCGIAQHNAPAWAQQWYNTGSPPNAKIQAYVDKVLLLGDGYKA